METKIDKFGRIVIPKPARDALALEAGDQLELAICEQESGDRTISLRPVKQELPFRRKGDVLVFTGRLADADFDVVEHLRTSRESHARRLSGLE